MAADDDPTTSMSEPHDRSDAAGAPGSGTSAQGSRGEATVGDEGAAAGPEAFTDPFGRPDSSPGASETAAPPVSR
ncbi:MAG TPA: hypothetical protein VHM89_14690 [Acidimicrobiales bacterium]|nr:hypothetical protein [Acidimicrobiales bacterium]